MLKQQQLLISKHSRHRAPNLTTLDRVVLGSTPRFVSPRRIPMLGALVKPPTLSKFHKAVVEWKYSLLFSSSSHRRKPRPKGIFAALIAAIVEMKRRNPQFGCVRITQQITHAFGVKIDKDVVHRLLARQYRPGDSGTNGSSCLTLIGHLKDSLWSVALSCRKSILLRSHWVTVVLDVFTRRLIGFGVEPGPIDGLSACRMFNRAIAETRSPKRVSTDHDPLLHFQGWLANLRFLGIEEIKAVPYTPVSHPFVERLIGTIRRECLDRGVWTACSSGMLRIWCASWTSSSIATMPPGCIVDSLAPHRLNEPAYPPPLPLPWINTAGSSIVGVRFRSRSPLDYEFARDTSALTGASASRS